MGQRIVRIYFCLDIILIFMSVIMGNNWLLNSQVAFFCSILIAYATYLTYKNKIAKELESGKYDDIQDEIEEETIKQKMFNSNTLTFFSPFKILSYLVLGIGFYLLVKFHLINTIAFFTGVTLMPLGAFIYGIFYNK